VSVVDENLDLPIPDGERALAARYSGGFQTRIILTFGAFAGARIAVFALSTTGAIPLWLGLVLLPVFAFVPPTRRLLPAGIRRSLASDSRNRQAGLSQLRLWFLSTAALIAAFAVGLGWPALMLWYLPARIQVLALIVRFAWFPHHPAVPVGRYVDTRVAVFPGSRLVIRGHDHHAVHHLFPRIPHYRLREFWQEAATELVGKGVRAEGRATGSTAPITW